MKKHNACIDIISSRKKCLPHSLRSLYKCFNKKYDYPVYVYYFDDIYDSLEYRKNIHNNISKNIHFASIPYKTPSHIKRGELFCFRKDIPYAVKCFSPKRLGYLHMCHFRVNAYGYPNTHYEQYDYAMSVDDESGFIKDLPYDPFDIMVNRSEDMGALKVGQRLSNGKPHHGHLGTRVNLWKFTKDFLTNNGIVPKSKLLQDLMIDDNAEWNFHYLPWADSYIIKLKMFKTELWKKWQNAINEDGGIYKYRWGDNELMSLFYLIYDDKQIYDLKTVDEGYHNQGLYRNMQSFAPSVKNPKR